MGLMGAVVVMIMDER